MTKQQLIEKAKNKFLSDILPPELVLTGELSEDKFEEKLEDFIAWIIGQYELGITISVAPDIAPAEASTSAPAECWETISV